jgi:putative transposase
MLKALATQYTDYGFDKLFELLNAKGCNYNHKRVYRLYCELGLNIRVKPKKRLAPRTKETLVVPVKLNQCWSLDYMSDALVSGIKFRTANVIDDCSRECLGILVSFSLPTRQITHWLDHLACQRGYPNKIRVDNGLRFESSVFS